jgi:broad specificity phosphatase PhoE
MIVFALRHADRGNDDALTPAGLIRADLLARLLGESGVTVAFRSQTERAKQTLQPLQDRLGAALVVNEVKIKDAADADNHAQKVVNGLKALPPRTVAVVVSHDLTVPMIIKKLTGTDVAEIKPTEFDKLFVVTMSGDGASTVALGRYGAPT